MTTGMQGFPSAARPWAWLTADDVERASGSQDELARIVSERTGRDADEVLAQLQQGFSDERPGGYLSPRRR